MILKSQKFNDQKMTIRRGFELCECLLVTVLDVKLAKKHRWSTKKHKHNRCFLAGQSNKRKRSGQSYSRNEQQGGENILIPRKTTSLFAILDRILRMDHKLVANEVFFLLQLMMTMMVVMVVVVVMVVSAHYLVKLKTP